MAYTTVYLGDQRCIVADTFAELPTTDDIVIGTPAKVGKNDYILSQDREWTQTSFGGAVGVSEGSGVTTTLLDAVTATGAGTAADNRGVSSSYQCVANGTSGAFSATVEVQVSNDEASWETAITFSLSGTATTADSAGDTMRAAWKYVRGDVTAISGTGANVTLVRAA